MLTVHAIRHTLLEVAMNAYIHVLLILVRYIKTLLQNHLMIVAAILDILEVAKNARRRIPAVAQPSPPANAQRGRLRNGTVVGRFSQFNQNLTLPNALVNGRKEDCVVLLINSHCTAQCVLRIYFESTVKTD